MELNDPVRPHCSLCNPITTDFFTICWGCIDRITTESNRIYEIQKRQREMVNNIIYTARRRYLDTVAAEPEQRVNWPKEGF